MYPPEVMKRFLSPRLAGSVEGANTEGRAVSFECGSYVAVSMRISGDPKQIEAAGYRTNGCGFMIASAEASLEYLVGKRLTELHGRPDAETAEEFELFGHVPAVRTQCFELVQEAIRSALANYRSMLVEEFRGERALVCTCFGVAEDTIDELIAGGKARSLEEVAEACNAGSGCGSCRMLIQEMIDGHLAAGSDI